MMKEFFIERRPHNGMPYEDYLEYMKSLIEKSPELKDRKAIERHRYLTNNYRISLKIEENYTVSDNLKKLIEAITEPQLWMVLTEPWCGDSAQCLPYIAKFARCTSYIDLRILLRDKNLDIMDQYLTEGKRGIPKLVAFDQEGNELFQWGPRPQGAANLFKKDRKAGLSKDAIMEKLHLWYAQFNSEVMEKEFEQLLRESVQSPTRI